jgi:hypothetical protein
MKHAPSKLVRLGTQVNIRLLYFDLTGKIGRQIHGRIYFKLTSNFVLTQQVINNLAEQLGKDVNQKD